MSTTNDFLEITGRFDKAWNAPRSKLITKELRNSRYDVETEYARLIGEAYQLYDIPSEGGLSYLSSKSAGKYLCVWKTVKPAYLSTPLTGTAAAGTNDTTHITLAAGASAVNDYYNGMTIEFTGGTGSGQFNIVTDYNGTTRIATVTKTWATAPVSGSTAYKIGSYDKLEAGDVTIHTDVIVTAIALDSNNKIVGHTLPVKFKTYTGDYNYKCTFEYLEFYYCEFQVPTKKLKSIKNCKITGVTGGSFWFDDTDIENCYFYDNSSITNRAETKNTTINNCYYQGIGLCDLNFILKNNYSFEIGNMIINKIGVQGAAYIDFQNDTGSNGNIDLSNVFLKDVCIRFTDVVSNNNSTVYAKNLTLDNSAASNYVIKPGYEDRQTFLSDDVTNWAIDRPALMNDSNYSQLDVLISASLENIRVAGNEYSRRYYELSFRSNNPFDDQFKTMFAREQSLLAVWRTDLDAIFVDASGGPRKVKNLTLYENNGTTEFDYRNNDNFFLLVEDASGNQTVLCWYEGLVFPSAFSDTWDDVTYTVRRCFQVLEPPERMVWRNVLPVEDSPVEGSGSFQDMTSIYVDKR